MGGLVRSFLGRGRQAEGFREFQAARRTIHRYEAINIIRKVQVRWVNKNESRIRIQFIQQDLEHPPEIKALRHQPNF
jgi:hypothetical protein